MHNTSNTLAMAQDNKPWYVHRWPWLLMLGPAIVILAGIHTTWIAFNQQDALVVGDYYRQGKAINQDLRRDRAAAALGMAFSLRYDAATGKLIGSIRSTAKAPAGALQLRLVHSTQPEKDLSLQVLPDAAGNFTAPLTMLDQARWQVVVESRDWRLSGVWSWPGQRQMDIKAAA